MPSCPGCHPEGPVVCPSDPASCRSPLAPPAGGGCRKVREVAVCRVLPLLQRCRGVGSYCRGPEMREAAGV
eukprot:1161045-Pelagomonas_calceolata.AAC.18